MTLEELKQLLEQTGLPVFYRQWTSDDPRYPKFPGPPFLCYLEGSSNHFIADSQVYQKVRSVSVELYTDKKEPELEEQLEALFDAAGLPYQSDEIWIKEEKMQEKIYDMELI
ncbi:hypothetical protein [Sporolactobacillus terrae]|uniref:DUF3168 domain-containing protein n=1 Tax=Sporolactobacillus terrae TaxID=269673 RepID=A0A5K7WZK1_9BACL|nr:hypothetical protein [Sporolactobacillus terrae]BBN99159.1 hypothetical protein St703_18640 [Sporolactobacillus terrae]